MNGFLAIVRSVIRTSRRERTALFFTLLLPIFFMAIFGFIFSGSRPALKVGVVDQSHSRASARLIALIKGQKGLNVELGTQAHELDRLKHDNVVLVTVIPTGFATAVRARTVHRRAVVRTYDDRNQPQSAALTQSAVSQIVTAFAQRAGGQRPRVVIRAQSVNTNNVTTLDFYLPSMIAYIVLIAGIQTVAIGLVDLRERKVLRRFLATPLSAMQILGGQIVGRAVSVILQVIVLIVVGVVFFRAHVNGNWGLAWLAILMGIACFVSIGFLITGFTRTSESARGVASAIGFPMMFLSGVFIPLDQLPSALQSAVHVLPLTYLSDALHHVLNDNEGLSAIWTDLVVMLGWALACFTLATRRFRWE
jgi:ABC-2 type transport system permease protein